LAPEKRKKEGKKSERRVAAANPEVKVKT